MFITDKKEKDEPVNEILVFIVTAISACSEQPAFLRSLARAFAFRIHQVWL